MGVVGVLAPDVLGEGTYEFATGPFSLDVVVVFAGTVIVGNDAERIYEVNKDRREGSRLNTWYTDFSFLC